MFLSFTSFSFVEERPSSPKLRKIMIFFHFRACINHGDGNEMNQNGNGNGDENAWK